mgnify:CR=1 FL=1
MAPLPVIICSTNSYIQFILGHRKSRETSFSHFLFFYERDRVRRKLARETVKTLYDTSTYRHHQDPRLKNLVRERKMGEESKVVLHGMWSSPFVKRVELAMKIKGIPFEYVEEELSNKSPLILKYNPVHKNRPYSCP